MNTITIRSVITVDVKIAQKALESIGFHTVSEGIGFHTVSEGDSCDYWVNLEVPDTFFDNFPEFKIKYK